MIDVAELREDPSSYKRACEQKGIDPSVVDQFVAIDTEYLTLLKDVEDSRAEQKRLGKDVVSATDKSAILAKLKSLSEALKEKEARFTELQNKWRELQLLLPSVPYPEVPLGKTDVDNQFDHAWGEKPAKPSYFEDHVALGLKYGLIDLERGVKISGSRNYFLKGAGVSLERAIHSYALDFVQQRGYTVFSPPTMVKYEAMMGTGYFPGGEESAYSMPEDKAYLVGTSEVPICSYHMDEILEEGELPLRYAGISPCYRREAGTYGKDTHGLYRVHQFYKVEQVVVCQNDPKISRQMHEELLNNSEEFLQSLELPYRVVKVCTGDMGQGQVFKHDIECYMPSRDSNDSYGETHSCSSFHAFQARRLNIRYRSGSKNIVCYTLNNTLAATPRLMIPLLELYQAGDGINIPKVLQKYLGTAKISAS